MDGEDEPPTAEPLEIVLAPPDYSDVEGTAGRDMASLRAVFVPADGLTASLFQAHAARLESAELAAMVIEVKPAKGVLPYTSGVELTISFGTNGTFDLRSAVSLLKSQDVYLVAMMSVCADELMALRNPPIAMRNLSAQPYGEDDTYWLDPYNRGVNDYILKIMTELAAMGFDEILLSGLRHPSTSDVMYSQAISTERNSVTAISNLAIRLTDAMSELDVAALRRAVDGVAPSEDGLPADADIPSGENDAQEPEASQPADNPEAAAARVRVSVLLNGSVFREGAENAVTGENPDLFYKIFDRVYIYTSAEHYNSDVEIAGDVFGAEAATRFVPFVNNALESGSFVLR